jgi:hypothetical protein
MIHQVRTVVLAFFFVLLLAPIAAEAQTAEETVAFLLFGVENGAKGPGTTWKQEKKSPAKYVAGTAKLSVQGRGCNYILRAEDDGQILEWHVDFERISGLELTKYHSDAWELMIVGDGSCMTVQPDKECKSGGKVSFQSSAMSLERHRKAHDFLRRIFCKRAF